MKIDNSFKTFTTASTPADPAKTPNKAASGSAPAPAADSAQFSLQSAYFQVIEQGFADTPIVNSARVAELKQAISDGHFTVNADKVADRLLSTVQDLIRTHKG